MRGYVFAYPGAVSAPTRAAIAAWQPGGQEAGVAADVAVPIPDDLILQLHKHRIDKVILAGMSANLCVKAHMRELLEQGFEVAVVNDATAAAKVDEGDGYQAGMINFRFMANTVWPTDEAVKNIEEAAAVTA